MKTLRIDDFYTKRDRLLTAILLGSLFLLAPLFPQYINYPFKFYFRSVVYLLFLLAILRVGLTGISQQIKHSPVFFPLAAVFIWMILGLSYTPDPYRAKAKLAMMAAILLLYALFFLFPLSNRIRRRLCWCLLWGGTFTALFGLYLQWRGFDELIHTLETTPLYDETMNRELIASLKANRALGRFGNPNHLAGYLVMALWVGWYLWKEESGRIKRIILLACAFILVLCIYRTFSRSGLLALLISIMLWIAYSLYTHGYQRLLRRLFLFGVIALIMGGILLFVALPILSHLQIDSYFGGRLLTLSTVEARLHFYRGALAVIGNHPWMGVGPEGFESYFCKHIRPGDSESRYVHNLFLESAVEGGIPGVFLQFWLLTTLAFYLCRQWSRNQKETHRVFAAAGVWIVFVFFSQLDFHNNLIEFWHIPIFFLAQFGPVHIKEVGHWRFNKHILAIMCLLAIGCWGWLELCRYYNEMYRNQGYYLTLDEKPREAKAAYENAVLFDRTDADSWQSLGQIWAGIPHPQAQLHRLRCLQNATRWAPRRASHHADYAQALFMLGYVERAINEIEAAQRLFPSRPIYYEHAARFYQQLGQTEKAEEETAQAETIKKAIEARKQS